MHVVFTDMKINAADIAITLFGIIYIVGFFAFVALLNGYEENGIRLGKIIRKRCCKNNTIKSIYYSTMTWKQIRKIFNF